MPIIFRLFARPTHPAVSAHYLLALDGSLMQLVPDSEEAWHAGHSALRGEPDVNPRSIGIEIVKEVACKKAERVKFKIGRE